MMDQLEAQPLVSSTFTYTGRGAYEMIEVASRTVPAPAAGEVRIAVHAAAVNPTDILLRDPPPGVESRPVVPGMDAAGTIEAVGRDVPRLQAGKKVMAVTNPRQTGGGAQAQHIIVPAASVVPLPANVSLTEAATLPMNNLTALLARELAGLEKGELLAIKRSNEFAAAIRRAVPLGVDALLDTAALGEKAFGAIRDDGTYIPVRMWGDKPGERNLTIKPLLVYQPLSATIGSNFYATSLRTRKSISVLPANMGCARSPMRSVRSAPAARSAGHCLFTRKKGMMIEQALAAWEPATGRPLESGQSACRSPVRAKSWSNRAVAINPVGWILQDSAIFPLAQLFNDPGQ